VSGGNHGVDDTTGEPGGVGGHRGAGWIYHGAHGGCV
jgi:hypothetical protein